MGTVPRMKEIDKLLEEARQIWRAFCCSICHYSPPEDMLWVLLPERFSDNATVVCSKTECPGKDFSNCPSVVAVRIDEICPLLIQLNNMLRQENLDIGELEAAIQHIRDCFMCPIYGCENMVYANTTIVVCDNAHCMCTSCREQHGTQWCPFCREMLRSRMRWPRRIYEALNGKRMEPNPETIVGIDQEEEPHDTPPPVHDGIARPPPQDDYEHLDDEPSEEEHSNLQRQIQNYLSMQSVPMGYFSQERNNYNLPDNLQGYQRYLENDVGLDPNYVSDVEEFDRRSQEDQMEQGENVQPQAVMDENDTPADDDLEVDCVDSSDDEEIDAEQANQMDAVGGLGALTGNYEQLAQGLSSSDSQNPARVVDEVDSGLDAESQATRRKHSTETNRLLS
ncbi:uncharacterized protein [Amphiura filiformis]|uniref:uncharacterized protein n=1 Tax=Amphiura filiformis TaxID=82378 RepID=UPI003B223033